LERVQERLQSGRLAAHAQLIDHWYLDVLPLRASRNAALDHLARRWGIRPELVLGPGPVAAYGSGAASLPPAGRSR
jgi:sucrose-phosphate synthase